MNSEQQASRVHVALIHHPVLDRAGATIGSAVTNLDLHDIARAARTYGVTGYHVITPYQDQQELVREICDHWLTGHGAAKNPERRQALETIRLQNDLEQCVDQITKQEGQRPLLLATSANELKNSLDYQAARDLIAAGHPLLLLFGTAHGSAPQICEQINHSLPPITGQTSYNHLSVRSAVSIILDRLLGER